MNCMIVEHGGDFVVVDCGVVFPDDDSLGMEALLPDWSWVLEHADRCLGLLLTHGHEDHIGSAPYLLAELDVPVYGLPLTLAFLARKLEERGLKNAVELITVLPGRKINLGVMAFEFVRVTHSIPDAAAVVIHTALGAVVHTGDFRFDHTPNIGDQTDIKRLAELGEQGVRLLLSDSTNVEAKGVSTSEAVIQATLQRIIQQAKRRVWVTLFASNLYRLQAILDAAAMNGRRVLVIGRSLRNNIVTGMELGYIKLKTENLLVEPEDFHKVPPEKLVVACTGSQGEQRAALFSIVNGTHRQLSLSAGDTVIFSARVIPGNDRQVGQLQDAIWRQGGEVITPRDQPVHTTGHAYEEEQKLMISLLRPAVFVPVHGDYRMLVKHADLARRVGVPEAHVIENGDVLEVTKDGAAVIDEVPVGKFYVDGNTVARLENNAIADRRNLAKAGVIVVSVGIDMEDGSVVVVPDFIQIGAMLPEEEVAVLKEASLDILKHIERFRREQRLDFPFLTKELRFAVSRFWRKRFNRRPSIIPLINEF
jgi:ribonuclease J